MSEQPAPPVVESPDASGSPDFAAMSSVADFRAARERVSQEPEPPADPPPAVEPPAPTDTPEQEAASTKPDPDVSEAARALRRNRADERKKQIQAEISDLVRQRNELRAEVDRSKSPAPPPALTVAPHGFPTFEQWSTQHPDAPYEAYLDAAITQRVEARLAAERAAYQQQQTVQTYQQRADAYAKDHPDFLEAVGNATDVLLPQAALDVIQRHPLGPALAHHLATHRDVAARLATLPPAELFLALGEVVAEVGRPAPPPPAPKPITQAPAPITPIGGSATGPTTRDPKEINSVSEWRSRRAEFAGVRT